MISGEGSRGFGISRLLEGMTSGAGANKLPGNGTSDSPFIVPVPLIVRSGMTGGFTFGDWSAKGLINEYFYSTAPQYKSFAELWLTKLNAKPSEVYAANVAPNMFGATTDTISDKKYTFSINPVNSFFNSGNGNINYSGTFMDKSWQWNSPPLRPPPEPYFSPVATPPPAPVATPPPAPVATPAAIPAAAPAPAAIPAAAPALAPASVATLAPSSSRRQYYDPSIPNPSIHPNPTPNGFAPLGNYITNWNSNGINTSCTYCRLDFAVVFQDTQTGYYSKTPVVLGNANNCYSYCNPTIYVALNTPPPNNKKLVLLNSAPGENDWHVVDVPVSAANGGSRSIAGAFQFSGTTALKSKIKFEPIIRPEPTPVPAAIPAAVPAPAPTPAPEPTPAPALAISLGPTIPNPGSRADFENKKCNNDSTYDGNCYPVCVPIKDGKVVGPPTIVYGGKDKADGPDGLPFDMGTANYFYERPVGGSDSGGEYYPITNTKYSRIQYGTDTDCTQNYACSPTGRSDGGSAKCIPPPPPPRPVPRPGGGPCDPSCRKVEDPFFGKSACKFDKNTGYTCSACPQMDNGEIECNNFRATCSGCGSDLIAKFPADWQSKRRLEPKEKPFTRTECEIKCEKPGVKIFQNYLDTFRDGSGFDNGSCKIIGRNMVKCGPIRKTAGLGAGANGGMKPIPASDECILCDEPNLRGYATFERKWDDYTKQNDYVNVKLVDEPRGAKYGPSDGGDIRRGGSGVGGGGQNWERWDGGDGNSGWRGNGGGSGGGSSGSGGSGSGWYQSLSDVKNKSFQVAASNAESSRQQAYVESLKLELNKINDEYTTQQVAVNKMKADIDKMVTACQGAKSKLSDAMRTSVSDDMNKNSAITLKEKVDANANTSNIAALKQNVKTSCDNSSQVSSSYTSAMKQLAAIDAKRQAMIEKLVVAMNSVTENKTTININLLGGGGGMDDCGDRIGCGKGMNNNNMYPQDYFKKQRINDMVNNVNIPMPYQDIILF